MLTKCAFIWSKIQLKWKYCEILLQFKITFLFKTFKNVVYSILKAEFSAAITEESFLIMIYDKNICAA